MFTEERVSCGDVALNVATGPAAGPPLLLLHGVTRRWQDFLTFVSPLTLRWQVQAFDLRGHGRSGRADRYRVVDYAADVGAFLRTRHSSPAVIFGHSLGALVAAAVAADQPERVRALVLEDPPAPALVNRLRETPFHSLFREMKNLAGEQRTVAEIAGAMAEVRVGGQPLGTVRDPTSLRFSARCLRDLDPEVLTPLLENRWLEGYDVPGVFGAVRCPVLLLRADDGLGGMLPVADADDLTARLRDCTRIDLPGVGHLLHWLATETLVRLTIGFLESL